MSKGVKRLALIPGDQPFSWQRVRVSLRPFQGNYSAYVVEDMEAVAESVSPADCIVHKGFFDAHLHLSWAGAKEIQFDFERATGWSEFEQHAAKSARSLVKAYGLDEFRLGVDRGELERRFAKLCQSLPDRDLLIYRVCGHLALVSPSLARKLGLAQKGLWIDDLGISQLHQKLPPVSVQEHKDAFLLMQERMLRSGVTAVGEMSLVQNACMALRELCLSGEWMLDVQGVLESGRALSQEQEGPSLYRNSIELGPLDRSAEIQIRHWKMYLDGSLGARTAWLSRAYSDADSFGLSLVPGLSLMEQSSRALRLGFSLSFHALGDAAVDQALDLATSLAPDLQLHGRASSSLSWAPTRHRLEHTQVLREDQIFRIRDQGWCLVVQPHHRCSDEAFVQRRLGDRYPAQCYRAGSLMNAGIPLAWSTDAPVDSPSLAQILDALETHPESKERVFKLDAMWIATRGSRQSLGLKNDVVRRGSTVFLTEL